MPTTFVATPQPDNDPPRTLLELEYTGQTEATISRLDPDGNTRPVRLGDPATLTSGVWAGFDYESWFGQEATYTATTGAGSLTAGPVILDVADIWLRHPGIPSLSVRLDFQGEGDPTRPVNQAVIEPLGRREPIVVSDGRRRSKRGEMTVRTETPEQTAALLSILDDVSVLLLDIPPSFDYGMDAHQYLSLGELRESRFRPDYYPHPWRVWSVPYIVVGRPAGGLQAERTYADLLTSYSTYLQVKAAYPTYLDLLTGG